MNDDTNSHEPTPEFRAALEREITRALRSETLFGPADEPHRARLGVVICVVAGAVVTQAIGRVFGACTGYASADAIVKSRGDTPLPSAPPLAVLKNIPPLILSCANPVRAAQLPSGEQGVPIVELPPAAAKTSATLGSVLGLRQLSSGNVLVNDAGRRQVKLFDSTLALLTTVRDSAPGAATSYGPRAIPLVQYLGDSVVFPDINAGSLMVMGPSGEIARAMAPSHPDMLIGLNLGFGGTDDKGRILFESHVRDFTKSVANGYGPESTVVLRADLDSRRVDTIARLKTWPSTMMVRNGPGAVTKFTMDPLPLIDQWALLSDGSIAIARGHDYHIDWIHADGTTRSTQKLPFDWKRLTDDDKQKLIDSVRDVEGPRMALALGRRRANPPSDADAARGGRGAVNPSDIIQGPPVPVEYVPPAYKDMFDYSPPLRRGALLPDLDGNLWILPASSAQSKNGELVYDVVNMRGDFHRVRVPLGRSVVGFGKGGVVFLLSGDKATGFYLERTIVPRKPQPKK
jgi:hypothetical protein